MKKTMVLMGVGLLLGLATGCAPEEKGVCEHEMKVYGEAIDKPTYLNSMDACIDAYANKKKRRGVNSYRREVECVLASDTQYKIRTCQDKEERRASR